MAYGNYKTQWTKVYEDSRFTIYVEWSYKQDPVANKTNYRVEQLKIAKNNNAIKVWNLDTARAGIAVITASRSTHKIGLDLRSATSQIFNLPNDGRTFTHYSDGTPKKNTNLHWYLHGNVDSPYSPEYNWHVKDVTDMIPKIDRRALSTSIEEKSKTSTSITVTAKTGFYTSPSGRYRVDKGAWKYFAASKDMQKTNGGSMDLTISGLNSGKKYLVEVQFQRAYNELWSEADSLYVTTSKPKPPLISGLLVSSVGSFSAVLKLGNTGNYWYRTLYRVNGGNWVESDLSNIITVSNLNAGETYTVEVKTLDRFGSSSNILQVSFTTLTEQTSIYVKYNGQWVKAKPYAKVGGKWVKVKKIYVKVNGKWVITK